MRADQPDLLSFIRGPQDVQALSDDQLPLLAAQIRRRMIDTVTSTGGHLGAGLGTVELTIALHRVFCSPRDIVVFDTGHQTYPHKLLTGRINQFDTLRQPAGLSGYPSRSESDHDWVENSHASVSLAWVDGIARALSLQGRHDRHVVAVIGDGALTGGVAWEGLNNLGGTDRPAIIVLNDNGRSYDPTIGAVAAHLEELRRGASTVPNLFEVLGFSYIGPVDGHHIESICVALRQAAALNQPVVVHAVTAKGRGYPPAEADEDDRMHACGVVDVATGRPTKKSPPTWTDIFEQELVRIADERPEVVGMTAAMRLPAGLGALSRKYPERVFDSGIAEQHLLACAAGLASAGAHPVVTLYSTFLNRAFDQLMFDVGLHRLPVTLVLDRAGITGPDGASHHGMWDLALLATVPGMRVACPRDELRLRQQLSAAVGLTSPNAVRYPKGLPDKDIPAIDHIAGVDVLYLSGTSRRDVLLIAVGAMARPCLDAAQCLSAAGAGVTVVDPGWVWPPNPVLIELASQHRITVTVEDGVAEAGIGTRMRHQIKQLSPQAHIYSLGLPTDYIAHAARNQILDEFGMSGTVIGAKCRSLLEAASTVPTVDRCAYQRDLVMGVPPETR
ncbi:1-deoxy-D-xylulose-5-phosphate synthase [Mycobacterium vicinigordonae]